MKTFTKVEVFKKEVATCESSRIMPRIPSEGFCRRLMEKYSCDYALVFEITSKEYCHKLEDESIANKELLGVYAPIMKVTK